MFAAVISNWGRALMNAAFRLWNRKWAPLFRKHHPAGVLERWRTSPTLGSAPFTPHEEPREQQIRQANR